MRLVMGDGQEGVVRSEAVERLARVGVSERRVAVRLAVERVRVEQLGRAHVWPAGWVARVEGESWADTAVPAVVVKCGPRAPAVSDPADRSEPRWMRRAAVDGSGRQIPDPFGRLWLGVDLGAGPVDAEQVSAVRLSWPLTGEQRRLLGQPEAGVVEWAPSARWLLVACVGGWVPPGYVWRLDRVAAVGGGRYSFEVSATGDDVDAYGGRWVPTRERELVDVVPVQLGGFPAERPTFTPRWLRLLDRYSELVELDEGHPVVQRAEREGWLVRASTLTSAELDALEAALTAPSSPSERPALADAPGGQAQSSTPVAAPSASDGVPSQPGRSGRPGGRVAAQSPPGRPAKASAGPGWRAPAAVLDGHRLYFDDGEIVEVDPPAHYGEVAELAGRFRLGWGDPARRAPDAGQIWLTASALAGLGFRAGKEPKQLERAKARTAAVSAGWQLGAAGAWQRVWRKDGSRASAAVVAVPWLDGGPLVDDDPAVLAWRLRRYAELMGVAYRVDPGATGADLARLLAPAKVPWTLGRPDPDNVGVVRTASGGVMPRRLLDEPVEADYYWTRPSLGAEGGWVHCFDRGGSYLAATSSVWCGVGDPVHTDGPGGWDGRETPGYWRVSVGEWTDWSRPSPLAACGVEGPGATVWVTTPTLLRLVAEDLEVTVRESWTWRERSRVFRPFYERLREARKALLEDPDPAAGAVLAAVKATYSRSIGWLARGKAGPGDLGWRPDWRHHIIAQSRVGIDLVVADIARSTGRSPVVVANDALWFRADSPEMAASWPGKPEKLGRGLGQYRWLGGMRWEAFEPILERPFSSRDALAALAEAASHTDNPEGRR